jgi:hypothetical protein
VNYTATPHESFRMPRIRLITDIGPSSKMTAGIILENIIKNTPNQIEIDGYILHGKEDLEYELSRYIDCDSFGKILKPNDRWVSSQFFRLFNFFGEILSRKYTERISREIIQEESRNRSDLILLAIQSQTSIRIALALSQAGYSVSTIWWDSYSWYQESRSIPKYFEREIDQLHQRIQKNGHHLVPSYQFGEQLGLKTNFEVFYSQYEFMDSKVRDVSTINICFVGQLYSSEEINEFLELMDIIGWNHQGRNILLHTYGSENLNHPMLRHHGWLDPSDLIPEIAGFDLAFLPYPKTDSMTKVVESSFPSKLAVYLSAGLPIIYVGPTNSVFYKEMKNFIRIFDRNNKEETNSNLSHLLDLRASEDKEIYQVWRKYFSIETFQYTLRRFMIFNGIDYNLFSDSKRRSFKSSTISEMKPISYSLNYSYYYGILLRVFSFTIRKMISKLKVLHVTKILPNLLIRLFQNPKYVFRYIRSFFPFKS